MSKLVNTDTLRRGVRWTKEEDLQLLQEIKDNVIISEISKNHGRTITGIKCRLYQNAFNMIENDGKTIDEVSIIINISIEELKHEIENIKNKLKIKELEKKSKKEITVTTTNIKEEYCNMESILQDLNEKQKEAVESINDNKNIFLTGSPGTGKSFTLMRIVKSLELNKKEFGITALTGCAAILINAQTVHSFLGLGIGNEKVDFIINKLKKSKPGKYKLLCKLQTLIIDEISMMDDNLFEKISELLCELKQNKLPFGGIQMILVGDFCQLSPVNGDYCFSSPLWSLANFKTIELIDLVRQKDDILFQQILQEIRKGKCSKKTFNKLLELRTTEFKNNIIPTKLYPINVNVDNINTKEFAKLCANDKNIYTYKSKSSKLNIKSELYDISLVKNAQIMITRNINIDEGLINGTRGIVTDLFEKHIIIKDTKNNTHKIEYHIDIDQFNSPLVRFLPVKLAYAMSIHKSQGSTLDAIEIDAGNNIFAPGQLYTALSRATSLSSIKILDIHPDSFITSSKVKKFYEL